MQRFTQKTLSKINVITSANEQQSRLQATLIYLYNTQHKQVSSAQVSSTWNNIMENAVSLLTIVNVYHIDNPVGNIPMYAFIDD